MSTCRIIRASSAIKLATRTPIDLPPKNSVSASVDARMPSQAWRLAPHRGAGMTGLFRPDQLWWNDASDRPFLTLQDQADQAAVAELEQLALAFARQEETGKTAQEG